MELFSPFTSSVLPSTEVIISSGLMYSMCFAISNTSVICTEVQGLLGFPKHLFAFLSQNEMKAGKFEINK